MYNIIIQFVKADRLSITLVTMTKINNNDYLSAAMRTAHSLHVAIMDLPV